MESDRVRSWSLLVLNFAFGRYFTHFDNRKWNIYTSVGAYMWENCSGSSSYSSTVICLFYYYFYHTLFVLFYIRSGYIRSGLVCVLLAEFERIRIEEEANLLETVMRVKERDSRMIQNFVSVCNIFRNYCTMNFN